MRAKVQNNNLMINQKKKKIQLLKNVTTNEKILSILLCIIVW